MKQQEKNQMLYQIYAQIGEFTMLRKQCIQQSQEYSKTLKDLEEKLAKLIQIPAKPDKEPEKE